VAGLLLLQFALALAALAWMVGWCPGPAPLRVTHHCAAALFLLGLALVGAWVLPPLWVIAVLAPAIPAIVLLAMRRRRRVAVRTAARSAVTVAIALVLAASGLLLIWQGVAGRQPPPDASVLDLQPPLQGRGNCAISAGSTLLLNFHRTTLSARKRQWRGQSHGVDFLQSGAMGSRTRTIWTWRTPADPGAYRIFGEPVFAPCAGLVTRARGDLHDQRVGTTDRINMAGNHVVLACGGYEVLLAHFRHGSLRVSEGESVRAGQLLAQVGNTGNSAEPHLHLSVQRPSLEGTGVGGEPVAATFGGRYLARHSCLATQ
jgi:murein DD-endopeptidase MepM/ murein hydrolase activator NlpD